MYLRLLQIDLNRTKPINISNFPLKYVELSFDFLLSVKD